MDQSIRTLRHAPLPTGSLSQAVRDQRPALPKHDHGRVDILEQTAHRGGETVTVLARFIGIGQAEKEAFTTQMQTVCGAGGTVKDGSRFKEISLTQFPAFSLTRGFARSLLENMSPVSGQ